jgi:hypothetical protein
MLRDYVLMIVVIAVGAVAAYTQDTRQITHADLAGVWSTGGVSTIGERNVPINSTTARSGNTTRFKFAVDGSFFYIGYLKSTMFGCTTDLFNDKQGKFTLAGSQITLIPSKNFWRSSYSCAPDSTKERDYVVEPESYDLSTKTDEYGKNYICLSNAKGQSCYRREAE